MEPFWIDVLGDKLEAKGIDPGNIWESSLTLRGYEQGMVIVTRCDPGHRPRNITEVKSVIVRRKGTLEEVGLGQTHPLVRDTFYSIRANMT